MAKTWKNELIDPSLTPQTRENTYGHFQAFLGCYLSVSDDNLDTAEILAQTTVDVIENVFNEETDIHTFAFFDPLFTVIVLMRKAE